MHSNIKLNRLASALVYLHGGMFDRSFWTASVRDNAVTRQIPVIRLR